MMVTRSTAEERNNASVKLLTGHKLSQPAIVSKINWQTTTLTKGRCKIVINEYCQMKAYGLL